MATTADRVVTELIADTSGHDPKIITSARLVEQASQQMQRSATAAETSANRAFAQIATGATNSAQAVTRSANSYRAGMQQLGFQINDVATQLASGTRASVVFAQQSSQVIQAIQMMSGGTSRFAAFMGGPWGIALTAGTAVLAPLIARLFDTRTELQKATDELEENARKAELSRQAHEQFGRTVPGIVAAIQAETESIREQNRTLEENQRLRLNNAGDRANTALSARDRVRTALERIQALPASGSAAAEATRQAMIARLQTQLRNLDQAIRQAEQDAAEAFIPIARGEAEAAVDPIVRITREYERRARAAEEAATATERMTAAQRANANEARRILAQTLAGIYRERDAALEAERERQRLSREGTLVRPVTGSVMSQFGADRSGVPINGRRIAGRRHQGVDLRGDLGAPVVAPEGGVATVRNAPGGLGLYVEIRADSGARDLLAHLSAANIRSGQRVEAGQLVGLVGASGNAAGGPPHLHWQRQVNGRWVDPMRSVGSSGAAQEAEAQAREARRLAEERARNEAAFQQELGRQNEALLQARRRNIESAEEQARIEIEQLDAARQRQNQGYDALVVQGRLTQAQADQLKELNDQTAIEEIRTIKLREQQRLDEQRYQIAVGDLRDAMSIEQARGQLARTVAERRESELRLLEYSRQEELAANDRARLQEGLTDAQRQRLDRERAAINQRYDYARQLTERRNMTPLQEFLDRAPQSAQELNEALEQTAVNGLQALNDGLAQTATRFLHLGGIAGRVLDQILSDMIRIALQQAELAIFGGGNGGGLGGFFGSIFGGGAAKKTDYFGGALDSLSNILGGAGGLKGFATGYLGPVGGLGGIDRNVLSINGRPRARVSGNETLAIIPQGKTVGFAGGRAMGGGAYGAPQYNIHVDARDAVLTHAVRSWVREGIEEATARGSYGGAALVSSRSARRMRQTIP